jgi:hypothetical protein
LIAFLQGDRVLAYDPSQCEAGPFAFHRLEELKPIEMHLGTTAHGWDDDDPYRGRGYYVGEAFDLLCECEHYDPVGLLVYVPQLESFGSYDEDHLALVIYPGVSWSDVAADPVRYRVLV